LYSLSTQTANEPEFKIGSMTSQLGKLPGRRSSAVYDLTGAGILGAKLLRLSIAYSAVYPDSCHDRCGKHRSRAVDDTRADFSANAEGYQRDYG
jgi:hypothetical protein